MAVKKCCADFKSAKVRPYISIDLSTFKEKLR